MRDPYACSTAVRTRALASATCQAKAFCQKQILKEGASGLANWREEGRASRSKRAMPPLAAWLSCWMSPVSIIRDWRIKHVQPAEKANWGHLAIGLPGHAIATLQLCRDFAKLSARYPAILQRPRSLARLDDWRPRTMKYPFCRSLFEFVIKKLASVARAGNGPWWTCLAKPSVLSPCIEFWRQFTENSTCLTTSERRRMQKLWDKWLIEGAANEFAALRAQVARLEAMPLLKLQRLEGDACENIAGEKAMLARVLMDIGQRLRREGLVPEEPGGELLDCSVCMRTLRCLPEHKDLDKESDASRRTGVVACAPCWHWLCLECAQQLCAKGMPAGRKGSGGFCPECNQQAVFITCSVPTRHYGDMGWPEEGCDDRLVHDPLATPIYPGS